MVERGRKLQLLQLAIRRSAANKNKVGHGRADRNDCGWPTSSEESRRVMMPALVPSQCPAHGQPSSALFLPSSTISVASSPAAPLSSAAPPVLPQHPLAASHKEISS
ncbi:uncharacterized protein A4U43_C07F5240 [Asparagus officinalis]|uniref:Uncharacterized protein n=1 Tax=Asparagus officinalis TaxID=4686 RepID=A0A5P1E9L3_ASPOF|nr:uncharacterized protein A4U43_C07F5240 [Asparagus officinalis]